MQAYTYILNIMGSRLDRPKPEYKINKQITEPKDATLEQIFNPTYVNPKDEPFPKIE